MRERKIRIKTVNGVLPLLLPPLSKMVLHIQFPHYGSIQLVRFNVAHGVALRP